MVNTERNKFGLTERDMKTFQEIFMQYPDVDEVHLFGSRAKGNYKFGSDVDLAIINEVTSTQTIYKLLANFNESSLPYTVDLVNLPALTHQELIGHIIRTGIIFYKKK